MAAHTGEQRAFIVRRLAAFESPVDIIAAFLLLWRDTSCDPVDVAACDPRRSLLAPDLAVLFEQVRAAYLANPYASPTADKRVRLVELHNLYEKARGNNQVDLAARLLAQIATEQGDASGGFGSAPGDQLPIARITRTIIYPAPAAEAAPCKPDATST